MITEYLISMQDEDEDVVLEGSELHKALTSMGYTNFDLVPRVKTETTSLDVELINIKNYETVNETFFDKINNMYAHIFQEESFRKSQLKIISETNILLDDHAAIICEFYDGYEQSSTRSQRRILEWIPIVGSMFSAVFCSFIVKKSDIGQIAAFSILGLSMFTKLKQCIAIKNLRHLVSFQNELHNLIKQSLKILRRTYGKKSIVNEIHEKYELIGSEKYSIILSIKEFLIEMFQNFSNIYYQEASKILNLLPDCLHSKCTLTNFEIENQQSNIDERNYSEIKSLYYTFILVQSESMLILATAYNGKIQNTQFQIQKSKLSETVTNLIKPLRKYYSKLSKIMQNYQLCQIQPVRRVFRGVPISKWQDTYIHLDLTSQRIQLAYKEIISIIESIDIHSEKDENNQDLLELVTEKMNEAYKQIESARSFAEFTSLLIAKAQRKSNENTDKENESENLFPDNEDKRRVIIIDKDPEIEDEVFEEYIREEYLKPLRENGDESIVQEFKLDKLLKKNFMSELKEVLIEKQKSMTERELRALKRMFDRMQKESCMNKTELEKPNEIKEAPPPPPPPVPPPILENKIIAETISEDEFEGKKGRTPVPLPRVKMLKPEDEMRDVQRFSISECTPNFKFLPFKVSEETFIGSGENSEVEKDESSSENEDGIIEN